MEEFRARLPGKKSRASLGAAGGKQEKDKRCDKKKVGDWGCGATS